MTIPYLEARAWDAWTRDERFFCSALYWGARQRSSAEFAKWTIEKCDLPISAEGGWDMGFEVVFYRDFLARKGKSAKLLGYSPKRTFDLCLFGEKSIIIIEAKADSAFDFNQVGSCRQDKIAIPKILKESFSDSAMDFPVYLVALISSAYKKNHETHGKTDCNGDSTLSVFDGIVTWEEVSGFFQCDEEIQKLLLRADGIYKEKYTPSCD
ncbi:hypothetical protein [Denitratimonas sp. CY0512]|uniref:hypothetical protein n=1 Tax=Denitratimonas sp. CY0512 TaxID=3131940 RepID=UPI00309937C0